MVVSDYCTIMDRGPSQFCEMSAMVTNCLTGPPRLFCGSSWNVCEFREESLMSLMNIWLAYTKQLDYCPLPTLLRCAYVRTGYNNVWE